MLNRAIKGQITYQNQVDGVLDGKVSCVVVEKPAADIPYDPIVILYEGNSATQDVVCALDVPQNTLDVFVYQFQSHVECENDEARSLVLRGVDAGVKVWLYDDPDCTRDDSTTKIVVKRDLTYTETVIGSFETAVSSDEVDVIILEGGNLDGKVSCVVVGHTR